MQALLLPNIFLEVIMDVNSTPTTDACSCGAPPSEWESLEDTVKKGPLWSFVLMWCAAVLGGGVLSILLIQFGPELNAPMFLGLLFGTVILVNLFFPKKPARSQVLTCRSCGANTNVPKN